MSKRTDYLKRLFTKVAIIFCNLGENEKKNIGLWIDTLTSRMEGDEFLVDDVKPCKCKTRSDVLNMNDKNYCVDCLRVIKEKK